MKKFVQGKYIVFSLIVSVLLDISRTLTVQKVSSYSKSQIRLRYGSFPEVDRRDSADELGSTERGLLVRRRFFLSASGASSGDWFPELNPSSDAVSEYLVFVTSLMLDKRSLPLLTYFFGL